MNNCPQCGAPISGGDSVCRYCGKKFDVAVNQPHEAIQASVKNDEKRVNKPISNMPHQAGIHLSNRYEIKKKRSFGKFLAILFTIFAVLGLLTALL